MQFASLALHVSVMVLVSIFAYPELHQASETTAEEYLLVRLGQVERYMRAIDRYHLYDQDSAKVTEERFARYIHTCPALPCACIVFDDEHQKHQLPAPIPEEIHEGGVLLDLTWRQRLALLLSPHLRGKECVAANWPLQEQPKSDYISEFRWRVDIAQRELHFVNGTDGGRSKWAHNPPMFGGQRLRGAKTDKF